MLFPLHGHAQASGLPSWLKRYTCSKGYKERPEKRLVDMKPHVNDFRPIPTCTFIHLGVAWEPCCLFGPLFYVEYVQGCSSGLPEPRQPQRNPHLLWAPVDMENLNPQPASCALAAHRPTAKHKRCMAPGLPLRNLSRSRQNSGGRPCRHPTGHKWKICVCVCYLFCF